MITNNSQNKTSEKAAEVERLQKQFKEVSDEVKNLRLKLQS